MSAFRDKSQGFGFIFPEKEIMFNTVLRHAYSPQLEDVERAMTDFFELIEIGDREFDDCLEMLIEDLKAIREK